MNRFYGEGKDGKVMLCVLEPGNLKRITEHDPIEIDLNDPDGPWKNGLPAKLKVVMIYSETPIADAEAVMKELQLKPEHVSDRRTPVIKTKRPHCVSCNSVIEQIGVWMSKETPIWLAYCAQCGAIFGPLAPIEGLREKG